MKILYVSQHYPPEMGALAGRAAELSRHFAALGHDASALTGFPNHPRGIVFPEYLERSRRFFFSEKINGVDVERTSFLVRPNRGALDRVLSYGSFCLSAIFRGIFLESPDVVIGTSPPLPIAIAGYVIGRLKGAHVIFEVRDLWPESLEGVGIGEKKSWIYNLVASIVRFLYKHSDHIIVVTSAFKEYLNKSWNVPLEKMSIVVNGVETERFRPLDPDPEIRRQLGIPDNQFVAAYVGTMGMAHGLETFLQAAALLQDRAPQITLLMVGDGGNRNELLKIAAERQLRNLVVAEQQPRERIPDIINSADVCLSLLKNQEVFKTVIPTKMLEYMSCGRPVVLSVGGQAEQILHEADAGISVEAENPAAIAEAILAMYSDPERRKRFGENGRQYVTTHFERSKTARDYLDVLAKLTGKSAVPASLSQSANSGGAAG